MVQIPYTVFKPYTHPLTIYNCIYISIVKLYTNFQIMPHVIVQILTLVQNKCHLIVIIHCVLLLSLMGEVFLFDPVE